MELYQKNIPVNIEEEMKKSYMDYAMSVIIGRAIPDFRDGFKPVHQHILFRHVGNGQCVEQAFTKEPPGSSRDIIGKCRPHGDAAA